VIRSRKLRGCASYADGTFEGEPRRDCLVVGDDAVALVIDIDDAEARIDGCLIRICRGAEQIVEVESCSEVLLGGEHLVDTHGKLIGVGDYLRRR
jgi:hypothetical protein